MPDSTERIADLGEDQLVSLVLDRMRAVGATTVDPAASGTRIVLGAGDDAAVLRNPDQLVLSTDTMVEGLDFRRDWSAAADVGVKIAAQNLADIAAMGADPVGLLISVAVPPNLTASWVLDLAEGLGGEAVRAGARILGGDVAESLQIVVTVTALGAMAGTPVRRDGARPGDVVALSGRTGPSAAGLALLAEEAARSDRFADLLQAHRAPRPDYPAGPRAAAAGAHAMIDVSDGLLRDSARIAVASGVLLDLDPQTLIPGPDLSSAAREVTAAADPSRAGDADTLARTWVFTGGEDHVMVACFPPEATIPAGFHRIGVVREAGDVPAGVVVGGVPVTGETGWVAFRGR